jgi:hypothetical protein
MPTARVEWHQGNEFFRRTHEFSHMALWKQGNTVDVWTDNPVSFFRLALKAFNAFTSIDILPDVDRDHAGVEIRMGERPARVIHAPVVLPIRPYAGQTLRIHTLTPGHHWVPNEHPIRYHFRRS